MPNLHLQALDEETIQRLQHRAARHHIPVEEEAKRILKQAVATQQRLGDLAVQLFGETTGIILELPDRPAHEPLDFNE